LPQAFFEREVDEVARDLLGCMLLHRVARGPGVGGLIVETEAYSEDDPASHSFGGPTPRNTTMFGPPGHVYIYRIYGVHLCLNVVTGPPGDGSAVLIRALEPREGVDVMRKRRGKDEPNELCSGPGKICQALGVRPTEDGEPLGDGFSITRAKHFTAAEIEVTGRIGVGKGAERQRRYVIRGNASVSRGVPASP
jgi:DNA-3-methyladenine glycosylase